MGSPLSGMRPRQGGARWQHLSFPRAGMWSMALPLRWPSAGDSSRSQALAKDLERRFPEDTSVRFNYLPTLRALFALNHGEPSKAIELLQVAVPHELAHIRAALSMVFSDPSIRSTCVARPIWPHTREPKPPRNSRKFSITAGSWSADPIGALAHLQLGRAYALSGEKAKAKTAYQDFLTLWKDADPDIPILKASQGGIREAAVAVRYKTVFPRR